MNLTSKLPDVAIGMCVAAMFIHHNPHLPNPPPVLCVIAVLYPCQADCMNTLTHEQEAEI